jgi:amino acid permease
MAANAVFLMTIVNSLGVCAAYSTFIGSTMATLSSTPGNIIFDLAPGTTNEVK